VAIDGVEEPRHLAVVAEGPGCISSAEITLPVFFTLTSRLIGTATWFPPARKLVGSKRRNSKPCSAPKNCSTCALPDLVDRLDHCEVVHGGAA
jgi:hypothetical protein